MLSSISAVALATAIVGPRALPTQGPDTLRVLVIVDDTAARASFVRGARFGADEAARTGALFGTDVLLTVLQGSSAERAARDTLTAAHSRGPSLLVASGSAAGCEPALRVSARRRVPLIDAGCAISDSARGSSTYSIVLAPNAADTTATDGTRLELWSASLERFGGEQLNDRYRRRYGAPMDSPAWTGWLAMKIALDLALHSHSVAPSSLLRQLADPRSQFDGQKGRPLRFDPTTRRLIQPAYRVMGTGASEHVVAEVEP